MENKLTNLKDSGIMGGHWKSHGTDFSDEWRVYPKRPLERLKEVARRRMILQRGKEKKGKEGKVKGRNVEISDDVSDLDKDGKVQGRSSDYFNDLPQVGSSPLQSIVLRCCSRDLLADSEPSGQAIRGQSVV